MSSTIKFAALAFSAVSLVSYSNTAYSEEPVEIITISGTRSAIDPSWVTGSIQIIDSEQILNAGVSTLTELLRTVPGVNISASGPVGSQTQIRFRGSEANHVLVTVDGVEINDGTDGGANFAHLLANNVERVEILKGPQSALWGSAAISGIINIVTKGNADDADTSSISAGIGNDSTYQASAFTSRSIDQLHISAGANLYSTDGENISREGSEDDSYENYGIYAKLRYQLNENNFLSFDINYLDYTNDFDNGAFGPPVDANFETEGNRLTSSLIWSYEPKDALYSQKVIYQFTENENLNTEPSAFDSAFDSVTETKAEKQRLLWINQFDLGNQNNVSLSYERVEEDFQQGGVNPFGDIVQDQSISSNGFLFDTRFAFSQLPNIIFNANYRYDNNSDFDDQSSYRFGASWNYSDNISVFVSRGKAIKNPGFQERFGFFPDRFLGNPDLKPESSVSTEVGISMTLELVSIDIAWFSSELEDEINGFGFDPETMLTTPVNRELSSDQEGLEVTVNGEIGEITWQVNYAYLDSDGREDVQIRRSRHAGGLWLNYPVTDNQNLYLQADYTGGRDDFLFISEFPFRVVEPIDNYWLVSANYRYSYNDNLSFNAKVENLFDEDYENQIGFVGQGLRALIGAEYRF